jgi:sugar phosphate isomerase/epimerase
MKDASLIRRATGHGRPKNEFVDPIIDRSHYDIVPSGTLTHVQSIQMKLHRRKFIRTAGFLASGIAMAGMSCRSVGKKETSENNSLSQKDPVLSGVAIPSFGLQLYTLRDVLPRDPRETLRQIADFGYKEIEGYEGDAGMFWGMGHKEFRNYLDGLGLSMISSHCNIDKDFERKAAEAGETGMKYLISPWIGPQKKLDDYKRFAEVFNKRGEVCKKNGIRFAYHNHGYSFAETDGRIPQDILMEATDPGLVDFEMDIYWVVTAGADPEAWLRKYPNRFTLCHVKDRTRNADPREEDASCDLGKGSIDFAKVLHTASEQGMRHYIMEQEKYEGSTPLRSAEAGASYLKNIRI